MDNRIWNWSRDPLICYWLLAMVFMAVMIIDNCFIDHIKGSGSRLVYMDEQITDSDIIGTINDIRSFDPDSWKKLSYDERKVACEKVLQIESRHLGLSKELLLEVEDTAYIDENASGLYYDNTGTVIINKHLIESNDCNENVLKTVFHECYHAYIYDLMEVYSNLPEVYKGLYLFRDAKEYDKEINSIGYVPPTDEKYVDYYFQRNELSSREYATSRMKEYRSVLSDPENSALVVIHSIY